MASPLKDAAQSATSTTKTTAVPTPTAAAGNNHHGRSVTEFAQSSSIGRQSGPTYIDADERGDRDDDVDAGMLQHSRVPFDHHRPILQQQLTNPQPPKPIQYPYGQPSKPLQNPFVGSGASLQARSTSAPTRAKLPTPTPAAAPTPKTRLRRACDLCSNRKVKCDESGPPCQPCAALNVECTNDRPAKRRGPPNRHLEAHKKRRLSGLQGGPVSQGGLLSVGQNSDAMYSSPTPPGETYSSAVPVPRPDNQYSPGLAKNTAETLTAFSLQLNAESILPFATIELLVDDFFTYIHPLCPFPHEPSFRQAFVRREDTSDRSFLALLATMVGVLVASFPRKPRLHLKARGLEHEYPNSMALMNRCKEIALQARGSSYLNENFSIYEPMTSYFLGLMGAYTHQWKSTRLFLSEALAMVRILGVHKAPYTMKGDDKFQMRDGYGGGLSEMARVNCIQQEIGKRLFYSLFVGVRSIEQLGGNFMELSIPPPTNKNLYPTLPLEIDDEHIFADHINPQPSGIVSKLVGFNINVKVYSAVTPMVAFELSRGDELSDWKYQSQVLDQCLKDTKHALDKIPEEFLIGGRVNNMNKARSLIPGSQDIPQSKMQLTYEIQKANIYASQLGTRSYIVEKYFALRAEYDYSLRISNQLVSPDGSTEKALHLEREDIVKGLLQVLGSISQYNMEPNGGSFVNKIRQIASTLISIPDKDKSPIALKSEEYLNKCLEYLVKLERSSPGVRDQNDVIVEDDEEELRHWADLRDYQMRFIQAGGFSSE